MSNKVKIQVKSDLGEKDNEEKKKEEQVTQQQQQQQQETKRSASETLPRIFETQIQTSSCSSCSLLSGAAHLLKNKNLHKRLQSENKRSDASLLPSLPSPPSLPSTIMSPPAIQQSSEQQNKEPLIKPSASSLENLKWKTPLTRPF